MYASFLGISEALHLAIFHQPLMSRFFDSLVCNLSTRQNHAIHFGEKPSRIGTAENMELLIWRDHFNEIVFSDNAVSSRVSLDLSIR